MKKRHKLEYSTWDNMIRRCEDKNKNKYEAYGGMGIKVCAAWHDFYVFLADMGPRPSKDHSIDRIDGTGDYEPSNCRWATLVEQNSNKKNNVYVTIDGITKHSADWAKVSGVNPKTIRDRLKSGMPPREAVFSKVSNSRSEVKLEISGEFLNLSEWSRRSGISTTGISKRLKAGMTPHDAVFTPRKKATKVATLSDGGC